MDEAVGGSAGTAGPVGSAAYVVLVPVKDPDLAKSRLDVRHRPGMVRAFALDAIAAALACSAVRRVVLVGGDTALRAAAADLGATWVPDRGEGDLNEALRAAADSVRADGRPEPVAAMLGDLPCLTPGDLTLALTEATDAGGGFVPDADGTGTTLLAAPDGRLQPAFGPGSREAHLAAGVVEVGIDATTLRRDVDTVADLEAARALGAGPHTRAALERSRTV